MSITYDDYKCPTLILRQYLKTCYKPCVMPNIEDTLEILEIFLILRSNKNDKACYYFYA